MLEWQVVVYPWVLHCVNHSFNLRIIIVSTIYPLTQSVSIFMPPADVPLFNMISYCSSMSSLIVALLCPKPYISQVTNMHIAANLPPLCSDGEYLSTFQQKLLLNHSHQVAYIQFLHSRTSNDNTGVCIVYVLAPQNYSYDLSIVIFADDNGKVTITSGRDNY